MNAIDYAIKRDVVNNPIVREVDTARQRELWSAVVLLVVVVGAALFFSWQHVRFLGFGYQDEAIRRDLAVERDRTDRLRLELETLQAPRRIEERATRELRLVRPGPDDFQMIDRVVPSEPPPASVVASR